MKYNGGTNGARRFGVTTEIRATHTEAQQLDDARRAGAIAAAALACIVHCAVDPRLQAEAAHLRGALVAMRASVRLDA